MWDTGKADFSEWNINVDTFVFSCVGNLLCKGLELSVQSCSASSFFLFRFEFLFVSIPVLAATVPSLVELHVCGFTVELDVSRRPFSDHNRRFEVDVDDNC